MNNTLPDWSQRTAFAALDWAKNHHHVAVVDPTGKLLFTLRFDHTAQGWALLREKMAPYPGLAIAVELNSGLVVEQLISAGLTVYFISPDRTAAYRQRKAPSGTKDDLLDAYSLAEALRHDGSHWNPLTRIPEANQELALLTRDEVSLIEKRTALVNQLQATLGDYFPVLLEAFDNWTVPSTWDFVAKFSTPEKLLKAGPRQWQNFLHTHRMWRAELGPKRMALFAQADQLTASASITAAKSLLAESLVSLLRVVEKQLTHYRHRIEILFDQHPDRALFDSLPGAGAKLAPRLLAEITTKMDLTAGPQGLQCLAGTAPIRYQSGKITKTQIRRACDHHLRSTVHLWCEHSRTACAWAEAYYDAHRKKGKTHACALRCLGQRWLKILYRMIVTNTPYNEAFHTKNQVQHGSWILKLEPQTT